MNYKAIAYALFSLVFVRSGIISIMAKVFRYTAKTGLGSNICLKEGFLPVPVHFYSPVPDITELERRNVWDKVSELPGIDFRREEQAAFLSLLSGRYGSECNWPLEPTDNSGEFYRRNQSFSYGCAASTHCMIRHFKPATVIEIGSGLSSRVINTALRQNLGKDGKEGIHRIVDPYPGEAVRTGAIGRVELVKSQVELMDRSYFATLRANDILFIDSSHSVKIGGDVNYLFLEILPRLAPGVIVHVHDIGLPYEYPRVYATSESFRQFWTEQYLLQGFLCFNSEFEVLLAMSYLMTEQMPLFSSAFPNFDPQLDNSSGSFWIRRRVSGEGAV